MRLLLRATSSICHFEWCVFEFVYFWDADRSSWSGPVCLDEVPLVSWQQVILHCFYEKIFTGVVVLYQSLFLDNLKQGSHFRQISPLFTKT